MRSGLRICEVDGCDHPAAWAPKVCVPPEGLDPRLAAPLSAIPGFVLCDRHMNETHAQERLEANSGQMRNVFALMANGRLRPDFSRAYLQKVSINSPEFAEVEREIQRQQGQREH